MARKRKKKTSSGSKILTYIAWFLAIVALMLGSLVAGYYFGFSDAEEQTAKQIQKLAQTVKIDKKEVKKDVAKRLQEVLKRSLKHIRRHLTRSMM